MTIALMTSVPVESGTILENIESREFLQTGGRDFFTGRFLGKNAVLTRCGIGKTNASHTTTVLFENFKIDLLILFGIGGAYPDSGLSIGDVALATDETYGDEGVMTPDGWQPADVIGIPFVESGSSRFFNHLPLDQAAAGKAALICKENGIDIMCGRFITVSTCSGTLERGLELGKKFGGICENMEGAAVAHVSLLYGVPLLEIRGVSNIIEDRDAGKWNIPLAVDRCQHAVKIIVERW